MAKVVSIGNQGFDTIRKQDSFYIDKTKLIKEWDGKRRCDYADYPPKAFWQDTEYGYD